MINQTHSLRPHLPVVVSMVLLIVGMSFTPSFVIADKPSQGKPSKSQGKQKGPKYSSHPGGYKAGKGQRDVHHGAYQANHLHAGASIYIPSRYGTRGTIGLRGLGVSSYYQPTYQAYSGYGGGYVGGYGYENPIYGGTQPSPFDGNSYSTYPGYPGAYSGYPRGQTYSNQPIPNVPYSYSSRYSTGYRPAIDGLTPNERAATDRLFNDGSISLPRTSTSFPQVPTAAAARSFQQRAEQAFKLGEYLQAAELAEQALVMDPDNGRLILFASHANFAIGDFSKSADFLDRATVRLSSDQWGFVIKNFRKFYGKNDYVRQTERLNQHLAQHPEDAQALTLRGYHYGELGYQDAATLDFQAAIELVPGHEMATRMLPVLGYPPMPIAPEDIQAPIPHTFAPLKFPEPNIEPAYGIIRLVPQFTDEELRNAVPMTLETLPSPIPFQDPAPIVVPDGGIELPITGPAK